MRISRSGLLLGIMLAAAGCSDSPTGIAQSAAGTWVQVEQIPGSGLRMTLASTGANLSGTGSWVAEAGPGGTLTVTGGVTGTTVTLDLVLTAATTTTPLIFYEHFAGHLAPGRLIGTMTYGSPPDPTHATSVTFARP